jgi:hypothetical protein
MMFLEPRKYGYISYEKLLGIVGTYGCDLDDFLWKPWKFNQHLDVGQHLANIFQASRVISDIYRFGW